MVSFCSAAIALAGAIQKRIENAFSIPNQLFVELLLKLNVRSRIKIY